MSPLLKEKRYIDTEKEKIHRQQHLRHFIFIEVVILEILSSSGIIIIRLPDFFHDICSLLDTHIDYMNIRHIHVYLADVS